MSATNDADKSRLQLEDALALLSDVDEHLRCALLKLARWARTNYEKEIIIEVLDARTAARHAAHRVSQLHPNHQDKELTR